MARPFTTTLAVSLLLCLPAGLQGQGATAGTSPVRTLADEYVREYLRTFPVSAALNGVSSAPADRLDENTPAGLAAWRRKEDGWAARLERVDTSRLWGGPDWVTYGFVREAVEASRGLRVCRPEWTAINHFNGWQLVLDAVAEAQPVGSARARQAALTRWSSLPRWVDTEISNARAGLRAGYSTPRASVEIVEQQLQAMLALPDTAWTLWRVAERDSSPAFREQWRRLLAQRVRPAVRRYVAFLHDEYAPRARASWALADAPDGAACYRALFRYFTSLDRDPSETYRLGLAATMENEDAIRRYGEKEYGTSELRAVRRIADSLGRVPGETRDGRLAFVQETVRRARTRMSDVVTQLPQADVEVVPYPAFLERGSSDRYMPAPDDHSRPATYNINLGTVGGQSRARAEVTVFHETWPGHHLQVALANEHAQHPIVQLVMTSAFAEGWARYGEGLAEELDLYAAPGASVVRRAWPAHGMVMDVGLNLMGWSIDSAVAFVAGTGAVPAGMERELLVLRAAANPAQLTAYDTGAIEIRTLRREAEAALGDRFDLRAFHDRVLQFGAITLPMLRESIGRWIAERQAAR